MGNRTSNLDDVDMEEANKFSHFPFKDIQEWSVAFKEQYPSGRISVRDLELIFRKFFPFGSSKKFVNRLFATINISQSSFIDFNELFIAFSILMKGSKFEKLRWIFRFYDEDNDGVISKAEMVTIAQSVIDMVANTLDIYVDVEKSIDELFAICENQSGFFTFDDFKELASRKQEEFKMLTLFID